MHVARIRPYCSFNKYKILKEKYYKQKTWFPLFFKNKIGFLQLVIDFNSINSNNVEYYLN